MNTKDALKQAERLLGPRSTIFLAVNGDGGFPDVRAMAPTRFEGVGTLWMLTGVDSDKCAELSKDPRCMIYATDLEDTTNYLELRLWGKIELLDDPTSRTFAWLDDYTHYFPGGVDDPNLVVLKFTTDAGVLQTEDGKENLEF